MNIKHLLATTAFVGFMAIPASAAITIYSDDFSAPWEGASNDGTDPLSGTTPDITVGTNTWVASEWRENGTVPANSDSGSDDDDSAFLAFTPEAGTIYTLSATLTKPSGGLTNGWMAIGFTGDDTTTGSFWQNDSAPWMLWRPGNASNANEVVTFLGTGTSGGAIEGPFTGTATFEIVLNTEATAWTTEYFVNGSSVRTATYGTNPNITHIGFGRENGQSSDFSNFSLTQIPEPSTSLIGITGMLALLRRRRN